MREIVVLRVVVAALGALVSLFLIVVPAEIFIIGSRATVVLDVRASNRTTDTLDIAFDGGRTSTSLAPGATGSVQLTNGPNPLGIVIRAHGANSQTLRFSIPGGMDARHIDVSVGPPAQVPSFVEPTIGPISPPPAAAASPSSSASSSSSR